MKKYLIALTLTSVLFASGLSEAFAQTTPTQAESKTASIKKTHAKSKTKAKAKTKKNVKAKAHTKSKKNSKVQVKKPGSNKAQAEAKKVRWEKTPAKATLAPAKMPFSSTAEDDDREPELSGTKSADFSCEMGNKITIYQNDQDDKHIAIRWNQHISRMTRVFTSTGANRFENHRLGLVWIGIPAKGILLDSKKGQQLANECKNAVQASAAAG